MKYIDDILYLFGWLCMIAAGFIFAVEIGIIVSGIAFFVTSWIVAKYKARHGSEK